MKKLNTDEIKVLIISIILLVIGILFCCSLSMGISGLSLLIGIILIALGLLLVINSLLKSKEVFTTNGIFGLISITLGILFMVDKLAGIIISFIPWFLIVMGSVLIVDALISKFIRNENNLTQFIFRIILGSLAVILGILLLTINGFIEYAALILGIALIIYSIYLCMSKFLSKKA